MSATINIKGFVYTFSGERFAFQGSPEHTHQDTRDGKKLEKALNHYIKIDLLKRRSPSIPNFDVYVAREVCKMFGGELIAFDQREQPSTDAMIVY